MSIAGGVIAAVCATVDAQPASDPHQPINLPGDPAARRVVPAEPGVTYLVSVGGEEIRLSAHYLTFPTVHIPGIYDISKGGFYEPLAEAARAGDDAAVFVLYEQLDTCKQFPKTQTEYETVIASGRKWFAETGGIPPEGGPPRDFGSWSYNIEVFFHRCEGVTGDMYKAETEFLRASAERGFEKNRFFYAQAIATTDPGEARRQYEMVWQRQGYLPALHLLGETSLPHRIAAIVAQGTLLGEPRRRDELLKKLEASTSPSAFRQASHEAAQLLKNSNCCCPF